MGDEKDDILKILDDHEKRLFKIEEAVFSKKVKVSKPIEYSGLSGGIRLLIDNKFFERPKSVAEIQDELNREGYNYPPPSISKVLSVDFMKKQKIFNRIKEGKVWKYVVRK